MATSRGRRPVVVTKCMSCGDGLVIVGPSGELEVPCNRQRCRKAGVSTPIRPAGFIRVPEGMDTEHGLSILEAFQNGRIPASVIEQFIDSLYEYRQIKGLIVIGPSELDRACRGNNADNQNPLDLKNDWIPTIEVPTAMDQWIRSEKWRTDKHWATRAALVLTPPKIAGIPMSLIGQQKIWGVPHDNIAPGRVRQDVFWSNWFVGPNYEWANVPAVTDWQWMLIYEHPLWTTKKSWDKQKSADSEMKMQISTAAQDAFALNVVLASTGIRLRATTYSRTSSIYDGYPLSVSSHVHGVYVFQRWNPGSEYDDLAASVQGVPLELDA